MPCFVYRNETVQQHPENKFLKVTLQGEGKNKFGIGAKVTVYYNHTLAYQEQMPMRGFESTVDSRLNFGLGKTSSIDSVVVIWNDGKETILQDVQPNQQLTIKQADAIAHQNYCQRHSLRISSPTPRCPANVESDTRSGWLLPI